MKMFCLKCNLPMNVIGIGFDVVELYMADSLPYKVYATDVFSCPQCGARVYATPDGPFLEGHETAHMISWLERAIRSARPNIILACESKSGRPPSLRELLDNMQAVRDRQLATHGADDDA